ncbi:hypothetical protein [Bradyrhizobium sp. STM 3562]|uniref:hypothetical protein n=1 Tax=Bradyrhizobium sp. STM 3562 TaxID=578924 RepID=UPI00388E5F41
MRVAVIVVSLLVVGTPSHASDSCMSKAEARQHFGSVHIYWHGPDHCWDATPTRHRIARRSQSRTDRPVQREAVEPKWREAMSEMLSDPAPAQAHSAHASWAPDTSETASDAPDWRDRWVDIAQVAPPRAGYTAVTTSEAASTERKIEPMVTPGVVILVLPTLILVLISAELVLRTAPYRRRW